MMNRSFRAETHAAPPRSLGAVIKEKDEELALFLEMRKREKERNDSLLLLHTAEDLDPPPGSKPGSSPIFKIVPAPPARRSRHDDFLNSDNDKNDYDWLLTPPGTPLFPSLEKEPNRSPTGINGTPKTRQAILRSRLANPHEPSIRGNSVSRPTATSSITNSSLGVRRPSSSAGHGSVSSRVSGGSSVMSRSGSGLVTSRPTSSSRPSTPTGRSAIPALPKGSRPSTPTSRAPMGPAASKTSLPAKPVAPRSSTPSRSATPTSRASLAPPSKPSSRASTPTRRPSTPSTISSNSGPPGRSSSVTRSTPVAKPAPTKPAPMTAKASTTPSRSSSPSVKPRPWKPSEMPGFSLDAPPNLRTSLPERPTSAARGRPGVPSSRSSSVEPGPANRARRQSCSPSRGRAPNSCGYSGGSVPATSRIHANGNDSVSPVVMGNKMVERVVNSRRLAPPKQEGITSSSSNSAGKSSLSPDSSGFGRNLSKKSLDMALRHMDIRRSIPNSLRPLMTKIPASSVYSVRSGPRSSRAVSASDSPLATSSNASSELSVSNNNVCFAGSEIGDDDGSER